jgi:hypothetical protein
MSEAWKGDEELRGVRKGNGRTREKPSTPLSHRYKQCSSQRRTQAAQYIHFAFKARTLRVSNAAGKQRGSYLLECLIVCFVSVVVCAITLIRLCLQKLLGPMLLASGCSLVLSAACHQAIVREADTAFKPVRWGAVAVLEGVQHCPFTSSENVHEPEYDVGYA